MGPQRIQRKRTKGWRMPENAVYVGRPTKWGNPYVIGADQIAARHDARPSSVREWTVRMYREYELPLLVDDIHELRGKDLACWCPLEDEYGDRVPCHADVLLELANQGDLSQNPLIARDSDR